MSRNNSLTRQWAEIAIVLSLTAVVGNACVNPGPGSWRFENCLVMDVYPDVSLEDIPAGSGAGAGGPSVESQINSALSAWYSATDAYYPTVDIDTAFPMTEYYNVVVQYAYLGSACGSAVGIGTSPVTSATVTFDDSGLRRTRDSQ